MASCRLRHRRGSLWLLGLLVWLVSSGVCAVETVSATLPSGLGVSAGFQRGANSRHAVLVLHGFLTTRHFNTVKSLVAELADSGYTVLAPTLSLGVPTRRASTPCDAVHTHTWEDDLQEVDFWVDWLVSRGYESIVLLGHSSGALQLLSYAADAPPPEVKGVVATSLVYLRRYTPESVVAREIALAEELAQQSPPPLHGYHLVFCEDFTATPASYLSYIGWTRERVLALLERTTLPLEIIMGGADQRFGPDWRRELSDKGVRVRVVDGASHFFDATHEFELHDVVRQSMEAIP